MQWKNNRYHDDVMMIDPGFGVFVVVRVRMPRRRVFLARENEDLGHYYYI